ncbi:AAA family ATPase [Dolichospermum circinale]|uniref:AAA family ATPase n=1 Tax=Dolichospermum circinale TaxID=109265 RepID=UPI0004088C05|nr:AAA family ATPase [Dolichospermum circinale]MDB9476245.1 AAA family ATPase [Dolichospermum circinale CS-537/11]MDB9480335.1 AAA family ATPase [Dolichospermum circinale CS-537/03]
MWVESITLSNIKCFREEKILFTRNGVTGKTAKHYSWITLLGENGVGKSTLLQALALLLAGPEAAKELLPRPTGWVSDSSQPGKINAVLHQDEGDTGVYGSKKITTTFSYSYFITGDTPTTIKIGKEQKETYTEPALIEEYSRLLSWLRTNAFASNTKGWFAVGYGAFRRLTRISQRMLPSLDTPKRSSNFITQFDEDRAISSFEQWMVHLDFRIAKGDQEAIKMREIGVKVIESLLPGNAKIAEVTTDGQIKFLVNGRKVPTIGLSDGYRSVIALAGDLIWRLMQAFPDLEDPTQASGVVLIDELDIHLHPYWQRQIAGWLRNIFPHLQFVIATHSPLIAAGGGEDALTLRLELVDGEVQVKQVDNIAAYDADYILRSPAFGLESTHSPATQDKIKRFYELDRNRYNLAEKDQQEYDELRKFMQTAQPIGGPPKPGSLEARTKAFLEENLP